MLQRLVRTRPDLSLLAARLALGIVMFPHGAQKALGWFGGPGYSNTLGFFTEKMGIPVIFTNLDIAAEFLGSLGLLVGFLSRVAAFGIACVMVVAIYMVHAQHGFFMNWFGQQQGEGFEYHLLALGLAITIMIGGAGAFSIDRALTRRSD